MAYILPLLETSRLVLKPWTVADIDALHRLWTDADVRRYLWDDVVVSRDRAEQTVAQTIDYAERSGIGMWCIYRRESPNLIGFCGFRFIEDSQDVEILYGLTPAVWKQGLALEACIAAINYGFAAILFEQVFGRTDVPNVASVRLLERLGMEFKGQTMIGDLPTLVYCLQQSAPRALPSRIPA